MYPAIYNNMPKYEIEELQVTVRKIFRAKMTGRARNLPNDIIHGHDDLGGMGVDKIEDTINTTRLKMVERFLYNQDMSHDIILGTIHRLREYARTSKSPMEVAICDYIDPNPNMWIYHLKKWMESEGREIQLHNATYHQKVSRDGSGTPTINMHNDAAIIDCLQYKTHKPQVWSWLNEHRVSMVSELMGSNAQLNLPPTLSQLSTDAKSDVTQGIRNQHAIMNTDCTDSRQTRSNYGLGWKYR
jgi:hypothetical protein